jgi:hypothetical protein
LLRIDSIHGRDAEDAKKAKEMFSHRWGTDGHRWKEKNVKT